MANSFRDNQARVDDSMDFRHSDFYRELFAFDLWSLCFTTPIILQTVAN